MNAMPDSTKFTVIMPSYNGADTVPASIETLKALTPSQGGVEFIFVDNRSTDKTGDLLAEAARALGGKFLSEERPGKAHALNTAIAVARGEFVVFIDDDVLVDPDWLLGYEAAIAAFPDIGVFAGQVRPYWKGKVHSWVEDLADRGVIAACTPADHPAGPYPAILVKGPNMMVRRSLLERHLFDTERVNFGASAIAVGGLDTQLMKSLEAAGEQIVFAPDARLRHIVQPQEGRPGYIFKRHIRIGRNSARIDGVSGLQALRYCADIPAYLLVAPLLALVGKRATAFHQILKIARRLGLLHIWLNGDRL